MSPASASQRYDGTVDEERDASLFGSAKDMDFDHGRVGSRASRRSKEQLPLTPKIKTAKRSDDHFTRSAFGHLLS
jgi:hypothetical protein